MFHLNFSGWKNIHANLSSLTNIFKSIRSKINIQYLEEHDPSMIKKSLYCITLHVPFVSFWQKNKSALIGRGKNAYKF